MGPVDLTPYLDGSHVPPTPCYGHRDDGVPLFYPGMVHSVAGESEGGKTWLALAVSAERLLAGEVVTYLDLEDGPAGFADRLLALGVPADVIRDRFRYVRPEGRLTDAAREHLAAALDGASVAIIDAVTEAMSLHELDGRRGPEVAAYLELLPRWIARQGPAVVQLDHVVKDAENRGRFATGSQHKLSGIDGPAFTVEPVQPFGRGLTGRSRIVLNKDRHGQLGPHWVAIAGHRRWIGDLVVESRDSGAVFARIAAPAEQAGGFRPTVVMGKVSDALVKAGRPLSLREIQDRVSGKQQVVRQAVAALVDDGNLSIDTGPRGAHLHRLMRPFDEDGER